MNDVLTGERIRFTAITPDEFAKTSARWWRDSEYARLADAYMMPLKSAKAVQTFIEEDLADPGMHLHWFSIRTLGDDRLIGDINLYVVNWTGRDAFVGIGIGERDLWGKGYGTEAMQMILRYAFEEVNLHRVTLNVFEYNERAIRSYEKAGFRHEGRVRQWLHREGRRWDMLYMSVLRDEWLATLRKD